MRTQHLVRIALILGFILLSLQPVIAAEGTKERAVSRVKSVVVSPGNVNDEGGGMDLLVQVELVEPAPENDVLALTILPGKENAGAAEWKDQKSTQIFQIHARDAAVDVKVTIHITKNGTIGIRADTSSKEDGESGIYWMSVTRKGR